MIATPTAAPAGPNLSTSKLGALTGTAPTSRERTAARRAAADGALSAGATITGLPAVCGAALPAAGALLALLPTVTTVLLAYVVVRLRLPGRTTVGLAAAGAAIALLAAG